MTNYTSIQTESFLEECFLKWVLFQGCRSEISQCLLSQSEVNTDANKYFIDFEIKGQDINIAVELDGYEFHSDRKQFTYDRLRQNDLQASGKTILRFSYDSIRWNVERCVNQLQELLLQDPLLQKFIINNPTIQTPNDMQADPLYVSNLVRIKNPRPNATTSLNRDNYFSKVREKINFNTLRECQVDSYGALSNYYAKSGKRAATIMSVGAGKTALGVTACLGFSNKRALIITPGSVIRGTFDDALNHKEPKNVLYNLPGGPLIPGCEPPEVLILDRDDGPIKNITREDLLKADIIVTNFHSLGTGDDPDDLISKINEDDIDFIVVDEAHIAASESYQRAFAHFHNAKTMLMSACFQRLDGKPIEADVVYKYRLIDSIIDGNAKQLKVHRFSPDSSLTTYEIVWSDGSREEIIGREGLTKIIKNEKKLANITAKSTEPIKQIVRTVKKNLDQQAELINPIKPRVLFSALGKKHAEQISKIANEHGISSEILHHTMTDKEVKDVRRRFESEGGDLQGIVQLKMLGQGYDFPPICIVAPIRPYGSFSEFYQFIGRGIRVIKHPALEGRISHQEQWLDIVYHEEMLLDAHIKTIYEENDMSLVNAHEVPNSWKTSSVQKETSDLGSSGINTAESPDAFVIFEQGEIEAKIVHDENRIDTYKIEKKREVLSRKYSEYAANEDDPVSFDQYVKIIEQAERAQ